MARVTEEHIEARRNQIVEAAWHCFARKGYHESTMQDIGAEAGLSAGAIYRYYPSKEALLKASNERSQEMGRTLLEAARSQAHGPLDVLQALGQTLFSVFYDPMFEPTARVNLEIMPEFIRSPELRGSLREELAFWRKAIAELVEEAQRRGEMREDLNSESAVVLFICAWQGLRECRLIDPESFTPEHVIDAFSTMMAGDAGAGLTIELDRTAGAYPGALLQPPLTARMPRRRSRKKEAEDGRVLS